MANNSNIRNIPLQANCDLAQFGGDLHNYSEFSTSNSLFMNKRVTSWKKRRTSDTELSGDIHYTVDGDDFVLLNESNTELGRVKREYLKLETVEKGDIPEGLNPVVNPFYNLKNNTVVVNSIVIGNYEDVVNKVLSNGLNVYANLKEQLLYIFSTDNVLLFKHGFTLNDFKIVTKIWSFDAIYVENTIDVEIPYSGNTKRRLYIPANSMVFSIITSSSNPEIVNLHNNLFYYVDLSDFTAKEYYYSLEEGIWQNKCFIQGDKISYYSYDPITSEIARVYYPDISNIENVFNTKRELNITSEIYSTYRHVNFSGTNVNYSCDIGIKEIFNVKSFSIRYGKWAVNFINNTPENIAYEYKKLFYLNGNQDSNGVCTDIDGYNDDYIYFHTQDSYYRISVDVTDNIYDQMVNVADYYLIFKTTSYLNAYYIAGNKWFCSCDDWNSRAQWGVTEYSDYWYLLASRKGKPNWINDSDTDTVSSQYPAISQRYALSTKEFSPYDASETWNGTDIIYDADGNEVDTSTWSIGHSLGGYYYISSFTVDPSKMDIFWVDDTYTAPEYEAYNLNTHEWETVKQKYTVYFGDKESSQEQALQKQGYITCDGWTPEPDETEIYSEPESATEYQDNPPLLDTKYIVFTQTILADTSHLIYTLLTSELRRYWLMYYTYEDAAVHEGDREFVINGQLYIYQSSQDRIVDANGTWVANAELFKYIGFSSRCAYFYCEFDKGLYMFTGDNTMSKLTTIEKYQVLFQGSTEDTAITVDSLNIPTIDLVLFNLDDAVGILYGEQFAILETGTINSWSLNTKYGTFVVNGIMYSLNNYNLEKGNIDKWPISTVPVKIETEFYGASGTENNTINDCIYLMLTNLNNNASGEVKVKIKALVNNKEIEGREKVIKITKNDFNNADCCGLKIQPDIQEAYGFKVILESDFEISEFKIGTTPGAMNQTRFRY